MDFKDVAEMETIFKEEIYNLYSSPNIIRAVKSIRIELARFITVFTTARHRILS
jgi:hypothetical protein